MRRRSSPNFINQSFNLPGSIVLFSRPLVTSFLSWSTCPLSLRETSYHRPRLFTGFLETVGIASSPMWNLWPNSFPLMMDMLLDLLVLIFIRAISMFPCSFLSSRTVKALVMVSVVRSSMYSLTGGSLRPGLMCCPPTTYQDAWMITSIAMVGDGGVGRWCSRPWFSPGVAMLWCILLLVKNKMAGIHIAPLSKALYNWCFLLTHSHTHTHTHTHTHGDWLPCKVPTSLSGAIGG